MIRHLYARLVFYPTLLWNCLLGRVLKIRSWWTRVDPNVILGARPFRRDVAGLHDAGVRAVVNTCQEYAGPVDLYARHGITQLHIPTIDFTHPSIDDVTNAVEFMQRYVKSGKSVYVHCKAGRARSATVVLCWMVKYGGLTPNDAQQHLLSLRSHVNPRLTRRPVVIEFMRRLETTASGDNNQAVD